MAGAQESKSTRKERIVRAAMKCYMKSGVAQTRMSEVAEKAGVDQPLIHYYFPTLDSLYAEVVQAVLENLKEEVMEGLSQGATDPVKALTQYVKAHFDWAERNPGTRSLWMYFYYLATYNPMFVSINQLIRHTGRDRISSILYRGVEAGVFTMPKGISVATATLNIQGIITGNLIMGGTEGSSVDWASFRDAAVQNVMLLCQPATPKK